ncbi:MAG: A/G-specific adenine glycosylase [Sphingomonadales bacterium]|nr:A/G-specific adenine glycosylase [Sphingomonadales bacterium]
MDLRVSKIPKTATVELADDLLRWYDAHARDLPWRVAPGAGERADPYRVWLSEVMLQQTTVPTVKARFERFLKLWPRVADLAAASLDEVLKEWAGLGYYARARNLHAAARALATSHGGVFPDTVDGLVALPGVGPYTAAAIAAIAFNRRETVVDGNVERVVARLFAVTTPLPQAKGELRRLAATLTPTQRPGDYAQGMMDLGATVCTPRAPKCLLCPIRRACKAYAMNIAETLPRKIEKAAKPVRAGVAYWLESAEAKTGAAVVLLVRRPAQGLLGGMLALPSVGWDDGALPAKISQLKWRATDAVVRHTFTHFHLELKIVAAHVTKPIDVAGGQWIAISDLLDAGLPTLMKKAVREMLSNFPLLAGEG